MEVLPGVHQVPGIRWSRVYLIEDRSMALVDSGPPWSAGKVVRYIRSIGRDPADLGHILMTHSHPDRGSSARKLAELTGARVVAHAADTKAHDGGKISLRYMGVFGSVSAPVPFLGRVPVSETVEDAQRLPIRDGVTVIYTPGHTPGSVCYLLEGSGVLFSGDTLFSDGRRISRSVPFPGSNVDDYRRSLSHLATLEFDSLCGGHGTTLVGGAQHRLGQLLASRPDPPTWGKYVSGLPRRLLASKGVHGEEH